MFEESSVRVNSRWSWLSDTDQEAAPEAIDPADVLAVMVVHNAEGWLEQQLEALSQLNPRPGRIVAVDNGSRDGSLDILRAAEASWTIDAVSLGSPDWGFGQAVASVAERSNAGWLWLLHDDSAPHPGALGELLKGAVAAQASVLYPTLLEPKRRNYPDIISEVGRTITRGGALALGSDEGEIYQGQDAPEPVLGGSSAGMLISMALWRQLGGFSAEVPLFRDGLEFGWRANEIGARVVSWPEAALWHRQAGRGSERASSLGTAHAVDRAAALRVVAARHPNPPGALAVRSSSWARSFGFLLAKSPTMAKAEIHALRSFMKNPDTVRSLQQRPTGDYDTDYLLPKRFWMLRRALDSLGNRLTERYRDLRTVESGTSIDELTGGDYAARVNKQRTWWSPVLILTVMLVGTALIAARVLLGGGNLSGGALLAAPPDLATMWRSYLTPTVGVAGASAPWLGIAALASTITLATPALLSWIFILFGPLFAAWSFNAFLRRVGVPHWQAGGAALAWAGGVILLGIPTAGDVSGLILAIAGPRLASAMYRLNADETRGAEALRAPASCGIWLAVISAAWPVAFLMASVVGVLWLRSGPKRLPKIVIALGAPLLILLPWVPTLVRWPGRILTGVDPLAMPDYPPATFMLLVGRIVDSGLPWVANIAFFAVLVVAALVGVARLPELRQRLVAIAVVALPAVIGAGLSNFSLEVNGGHARALLSGWALLTIAALVWFGISVESYEDEEATASETFSIIAQATAGVLAAVTWAVYGFSGPVQVADSKLPGYVIDVVYSPRASRVLMLQLGKDNATVLWNVVDKAKPTWGSAERSPLDGFEGKFEELVPSLAGNNAPEDLAQRLAELGVSHVYLANFNLEQLAAAANSSGLSRAAVNDREVVLTVVGLIGRARLSTEEETKYVTGAIEAVDSERSLKLAEPQDGRWEAKIGDQRLSRVEDQSSVAFKVPSGTGGELEYGLRGSWGTFAWHLILTLALLGMAAPTLNSGSQAKRGEE